MKVHHIVLPEVWANFRGASYEADSLSSEGFIHCSFTEQIDDVLARYYKNAERVTILEIDPTRLTSALVVEPSTGGENYPHIYGPINIEAIVDAQERFLG
jgi:uncharacterized protein (DUF952 family)